MKKQPFWDPYAEFERTVLPNGLTVYSSFWKRNWLEVFFVVHAGSRNDTAKKDGVAHFVEHLVSENVPSLKKIEIENFFYMLVGLYPMLGRTSLLKTKYSFKIPANVSDLRKSLKMFGEILIKPKLEKHIERERSIIIQEFYKKNPLPLTYEDYFLRKFQMLFHGLALEDFKGTIGNPETIDNINMGDLQKFADQYYIPQNISVVFVGGMKHKEIISCLSDSLFAHAHEGRRNLPLVKLDVVYKPKEAFHCISSREIVNENINTAHVASYETRLLIPGSVNGQAVGLTLSILDQLLFNEVREKLASAYSFASSWSDLRDVYEVGIGGQINPNVIDEIEQIVESCIEQIPRERKLFDENKLAKINYFKFYDIKGEILAIKATEEIGDDQVLTNLKKNIKEVESVTFEEVCRLAEYMLVRENRWTYIYKP